MFQNYIYSQKQNIISNVCDLITYPSISEESESAHFPFGKDCSDCLKYFLNLASSLGFRTKNVDGYCGYVEFGEGEEIVGIVGHLDVVPAKEEDWSYSPFTPTVYKNRIYGRGAIDDKGPMVASLYAMKAVMEYLQTSHIPLKKRIRLIVGLNEEKDWKCISYYKEHEEFPTIGFSPDADFPCIYAEKGVLSILLKQDLSKLTFSKKFPFGISASLPIEIESLECQNNAINVVPEIATCILKLQKNLNASSVITALKKQIDHYDYDMDLYKVDDTHIKITSYGISAHSAHPELGQNAISKLLCVINDVLLMHHVSIPLLSTFCTFIGDDYTGKGLKLNLKDESGSLTLNTAQCYIKDNFLCIGINFRIPVTYSSKTVLQTFTQTFAEKGIEISVLQDMAPLFIDKENPLVSKLCHIFNETCGASFSPLAIGGATYSRAFPNMISFGMNFPGDKDMCHQVDEFVDIDKLLLSTNIYAKAIYELSVGE